MNQKLNFNALLKNLIDMIMEAQIKLGCEETAVSFYYPLDSLCTILGEKLSYDEMRAALSDFCKYANSALGSIEVTLDDERFCLRVPAEGAKYVHEKVTGYDFLEEFINRICLPCTIDDLLCVFKKYSDNVKCVKADEDEFDYVVYFADGVPDNYFYCIQLEMGHASYHRFTPGDYKAFGFEYK